MSKKIIFSQRIDITHYILTITKVLFTNDLIKIFKNLVKTNSFGFFLEKIVFLSHKKKGTTSR